MNSSLGLVNSTKFINSFSWQGDESSVPYQRLIFAIDPRKRPDIHANLPCSVGAHYAVFFFYFYYYFFFEGLYFKKTYLKNFNIQNMNNKISFNLSYNVLFYCTIHSFFYIIPCSVFFFAPLFPFLLTPAVFFSLLYHIYIVLFILLYIDPCSVFLFIATVFSFYCIIKWFPLFALGSVLSI